MEITPASSLWGYQYKHVVVELFTSPMLRVSRYEWLIWVLWLNLNLKWNDDLKKTKALLHHDWLVNICLVMIHKNRTRSQTRPLLPVTRATDTRRAPVSDAARGADWEWQCLHIQTNRVFLRIVFPKLYNLHQWIVESKHSLMVFTLYMTERYFVYQLMETEAVAHSDLRGGIKSFIQDVEFPNIIFLYSSGGGIWF